MPIAARQARDQGKCWRVGHHAEKGECRGSAGGHADTPAGASRAISASTTPFHPIAVAQNTASRTSTGANGALAGNIAVLRQQATTSEARTISVRRAPRPLSASWPQATRPSMPVAWQTDSAKPAAMRPARAACVLWRSSPAASSRMLRPCTLRLSCRAKQRSGYRARSTKLKLLKRQMYGRASFELLRAPYPAGRLIHEK